MVLYLGTTQSWTVAYSDYKASDGWACTLYLVNANNNYNITSTAEGDDFKFALIGNETFVPGEYVGYYFVTKGSEKYKVDDVSIKIYPNLTAGVADTRSHVKKVLDALEAFIEGIATSNDIDVLRAEIGQDVALWKDSEKALIWYEKYKRLYNDELRAEKIRKGLNVKNIYVRFK